MIKITFPDGSVREYNEGVTGLQIAESISSRLAQDVLACGVNGEVYDLGRPISEDAEVVLYKWEDEQGKHAFWHTSAHLLAEALQELYPGIQFGIGPAIENGFYYDVDPGETAIKEADLPAIEKKMAELAAKKEAVVRESISKTDALKMFGDRGETYKCELISELEDGHITTYTQGAFTDLCRGPHLMTTAPIKAIKLTSVAGAYWRGQEDRKMMTRIYGITFPKKKMLDEYLVLLEEAKKRDHRKIGKEMDLFMFSDTVGKGLPMWLPKGAALRIRLQEFLRRIQARYDYQEVMCPPIGNKLLYITSGHYAKYGKDSFQPIHTPEEGEEYFLKPMNCPHHCMIYKNSPRSYKDLPLRLAEFGTVCRYEQSGELHGLTRVRSFTQDDAHIFCRPDQVKDEFLRVMDIISIVFQSMHFENFEAQISLRDKVNREKYIGSDENWEKAEQAIIEACEEKGLKARVEYGEAAFYGPKLDIQIKNVYGKEDTLITIQIDQMLAEGKIYEDAVKHNVIFIGYDPKGTVRYAGIRGTKEKYRGDAPGSEKAYGFSHTGTDDTLFVFEAPIDLLSFLSATGDGWETHHYISLGGVSEKALIQYLADHKKIRKIFLCLDNDTAGNAACEKLAEKIPDDKMVMRLRPVKKDWNECLTAGIICFGFFNNF